MAQPRRRGDASPSREAIAAAALAYVDDADLESLSVRGLADGLGSFHANLYRRIASKDELLDLVAERIYAEAGAPPRPEADGRAELIDYAHRLRAAWLAHPKAYPLLARQHPALLAALDGIVGALLGLGLTHRQVQVGLRDYLGHVYGSILTEALTAVTPRRELEVPAEYRFLHEMQSQPPGDAHLTDVVDGFASGITKLVDGLRKDR